ncbi:hypothetical protein P3T31_004298 [Rhizobium sp. AN70]|nr:hypothetical protein [Rhizobium sp. AN70]
MPQAPNFCAIVIDGAHVFVDINRFDGHGRGGVIQQDGKMRIQNVEPDAHNLRTFGTRSALRERYKSPHSGVMRNTVAIVGMVLGLHVDERRQGRINDVTDRLALGRMMIERAHMPSQREHRYGVGPKEAKLVLGETEGDPSALGATLLPLRVRYFL